MMMEIKGKVNTAICYAKVIEDGAVEQIRRMCDYPFTEGSRIRIMPDVHSGKGCTIGTTMTIIDKVVPNIVGVDLGAECIPSTWGATRLILQGWMRQPILSLPGLRCGTEGRNALI